MLKLLLILGLGTGLSVSAAEVPNELKDIGIKEHLGATISADQLSFKDDTGAPVTLSKYLGKGKPVVLAPIYYGCPNLCNFLLNGFVESLQKMNWIPGREFDVVAVSIDPTEKPELASQKKQAYLAEYKKPESAAGWHFLTGDPAQIQKITSEVGFGYKWDAKEKQYAHAATLVILTPNGKISRYLYGITFRPTDLKMALLEASNGKIGTIIDRFLLFCYRYNPTTGKYSFYLTTLMQVGTVLTVVLMGTYLGVFWMRQRRQLAGINPAATELQQGG
jgi:protein SCO1/2